MKKYLILILFPFLLYSQGFTTLGILMGDEGGYSTAAKTYFNNLPVEIGSDTLDAIATFIDGRVASGVWAKLDECWLLANKTEANALIGMKGYKNCLKAGSITFAVYNGFRGDNSTGYLNTQFKPSTDGVKFTLNNSSMGVFAAGTNTLGTYCYIGARDGSGNKSTELRPRQASNLTAYSQSSNSLIQTDTSYTTLGFFAVVRTSSSNIIGYKNDISSGNLSENADGLTGYNLFIGSINNAGNPLTFATTSHVFCFAFVGGTLTASDITDLRNGIKTLLTFLGTTFED